MPCNVCCYCFKMHACMYLENISIELCGNLVGTFSGLVCWKPVFVEYFEVERETKSKLAALIVKRNSMRPQMSGIENSEGCVRVVGEGGGGFPCSTCCGVAIKGFPQFEPRHVKTKSTLHRTRPPQLRSQNQNSAKFLHQNFTCKTQ